MAANAARNQALEESPGVPWKPIRGARQRYARTVHQQTELTSTQQLTLLALLDHADQEGKCAPRMERLARWTSFEARTIRKTLRELEPLGWVRVVARYTEARDADSNLYRLTYPRTLSSPGSSSSSGGSSS